MSFTKGDDVVFVMKRDFFLGKPKEMRGKILEVGEDYYKICAKGNDFLFCGSVNVDDIVSMRYR